jgi:chromosome segregation ATPase
MKLSALPVILILACLGLGAVLFVEIKKHTEETQKEESTIINFSNNVNTLEGKLTEQRDVNHSLETNLDAVRLQDTKTLASLTAARLDLTNVTARLEETKVEAKMAATAAADIVADRDKKIADLESQNQGLDREAGDLRGSITNLQTQIEATQKKLAASEGDKKTLLSELKKLQAEKADLEKKFYDLAALKEQVRKMKDELSIERKLDWIRRGVYDSIKVKGGELLTHPEHPEPPPTNGTLDAEIRQNGGVRILSPDSTNTAPRK